MEDRPTEDTPRVDPAPAGMPPPVAGPKPIVERAKDLLTQPKAEWTRIEGEAATVGGLYTAYVMILAAIPPIALAIGLFLFVPRTAVVYGVAISYGLSATSIIAGAVVQYLLSLASVYVMALIIDGLAPTFGATRDRMQAFKVAAYYPTAAWIAGILMIIPGLGVIAALVGGIYSLYLLYVGLPVLMKVSQDKLVGYFIATLVAAIVIFAIIGAIGNRVLYGGMF